VYISRGSNGDDDDARKSELAERFSFSGSLHSRGTYTLSQSGKHLRIDYTLRLAEKHLSTL